MRQAVRALTAVSKAWVLVPSSHLASELGGNRRPSLKFQKNATGYEDSTQSCIQGKTNIVLMPLIMDELPVDSLIALRELKIKAQRHYFKKTSS